MENEKKFEEIFDEYTFTKRTDDSLKSYSNWLLGISLGLAAALVSLITNDSTILLYFLIPLILVFIGILINGFIKRQIFIREILMNTQFGVLKQIKIKREARIQAKLNTDDKSDMDKWTIAFNKYTLESNKIATIAKHLNWATYYTFFNVLITGITIIILILKNVCQHRV
ncbi:hypothetical protein [Winogradskyella vidalii]|uniref:hypothetical protein n=1 Tax=Winogradskyella vidalii TaxID=2615024 RepID=UPI0015C69A2A|nr:hypothetical protein [Winogradskyella vidalii]